MTKDELLKWALEHYFAEWEIERSKKVLDKSGLRVATEYLRRDVLSGARGYCGGDLRYETRSGKLLLWGPGDYFNREPDLVLNLEWFCKFKL